jgi:hypothetical protein
LRDFVDDQQVWADEGMVFDSECHSELSIQLWTLPSKLIDTWVFSCGYSWVRLWRAEYSAMDILQWADGKLNIELWTIFSELINIDTWVFSYGHSLVSSLSWALEYGHDRQWTVIWGCALNPTHTSTNRHSWPHPLWKPQTEIHCVDIEQKDL